MISPPSLALRPLRATCATPAVRAILAILAVLAQPALAHACTVCNSPNGQAVRAGLWNGHFLHTLTLVLLPFPVLAALVSLVATGMPDLAPPATPARDKIPAAELLPQRLS